MDLRLGRWQDVLADVGEVDAVVTDPPYGARTHAGNTGLATRTATADNAARRDLSYCAWTPDDVRAFVAYWAPRTRGWMVCFTSDDLIPVYREAYAEAGRLDFAPVPFLAHRPRLVGDGPGSGACYVMVARPRAKRFLSWGSLPCWYGPVMSPRQTDPNHHIGGKPLAVMAAIIRDYSRLGDLIVDPCAGGATTLLAAVQEGRRAIGAECDPETYARASERIRVWQPSFRLDAIAGKQGELL